MICKRCLADGVDRAKAEFKTDEEYQAHVSKAHPPEKDADSPAETETDGKKKQKH